MAKRPGNLQYANDEVPPPLSIGILAFQHSAIVLINLVYVVIITKALNLSAADQFAMLSTTLLVLGIGLVLLFEWGNPGTLGPMGVGDKILNGGFQGISPRTAGFNSVDYAQMKPESLMITDFLMFIGAGSVSTSGGIKVTTAATRSASDDHLRDVARSLINEMHESGTTTIEIKSGYGLDVATEERSVRIASELTDEVTFLGAHVVAPEFSSNADEYVDLVYVDAQLHGVLQLLHSPALDQFRQFAKPFP